MKYSNVHSFRVPGGWLFGEVGTEHSAENAHLRKTGRRAGTTSCARS